MARTKGVPTSQEPQEPLGQEYDAFESCDEGEDLPSGPPEHAGEVHSLEAGADAGPPKSLRSADQATANERQPVGPPLAPEGPSDPTETYTKVEVEDRLAAVQFQITQELDRRFQEKISRLQQELQQERAAKAELTDRVAELTDRVADLEAAQQQTLRAQEEQRAHFEAFRVRSDQIQSDLERQLEATEVRERAPCLMMHGLSEEHAAEGQALHGAVTQRLVGSAGPHGFASSTVVSATRVGRPNPGRASPRPVLVRCSTVAAKHQAFRGRRALRSRDGIIIDEYLTPTQLRSRTDQQGDFDRLRQISGANPHWRNGDILYCWEDDRPVPYSASSLRMPAPPAAQPAASARGRRRPSRGGSASHGAGVSRSAARASRASPPGPPSPRPRSQR